MTGPPSRPGINKMKNNTVALLRPAVCDWLSGGPPGLKSGHVELHLQRRVWTKVRLWSALVYLSALSRPAWPAGGAVATAGLVINTQTVWFFLKMLGFHQERCLLIKRAFTFCHSFLSDSANYFSQFVFPALRLIILRNENFLFENILSARKYPEGKNTGFKIVFFRGFWFDNTLSRISELFFFIFHVSVKGF